MITDNPYLRHTKSDRTILGKLTPNAGMSTELDGYLREAMDFISREQLFDRALWKKFVEQFRIQPDSAKGRWRGEFWGKMMRGAAYVYSVTKDPELYDILEETTRDLLTVPDEDGRISSYLRGDEFKNWDMWSRKYVLLGLICFHRICRDESLKAHIIEVATGHADYILDRIGPESEGKMPICQTSVTASGTFIHGAFNSLSILEPMVILHRLTGEQRYLDFSDYIVNEGVGESCNSIFELAAEDIVPPYQFKYTKAYEMISCFEGLLEYSYETDNEKCREAAIKFAYKMAETDITVMGSAGTAHEFLNHASVRQTVHKGIGQETCVSVTWMKFCARMLLLTGDPLFADCFEQTLYNAYIGSLNTTHQDNSDIFADQFREMPVKLVPTVLPFDSYTPVLGGTRGWGIGGSMMFTDGTFYGCCASIASAGMGIAPYLCALGRENGIAVMLYAPGSFGAKTPSGQNIIVKMQGNYPFEDKTTLSLSLEKDEEFTLTLRVPSWSEKTGIFVNGKALKVTNGATEIKRVWKSGDTVEITFDMRVEALTPTKYETDTLREEIDWNTCNMIEQEETADPDSYKFVALRRGPVILARESEENAPIGTSFDRDTYISATADIAYNGISVYAKLGDTAITLKDNPSVGKNWKESFNIWMRTE